MLRKETILTLLVILMSGMSMYGQNPSNLSKGKNYWDKAQVAYERKDYNATFKNDKKSAELGYSRGMLSLGVCYAAGIGTSKDYSQAYYWYNKAIEHPEDAWTYSRGITNIADLYLNGEGVEKDSGKAARIISERIDNLSGEYEYVYNFIKNKFGLSKANENKDVAYALDFLETKGFGNYNQAFPFKRSFEMRSEFAVDKVKAKAEAGDKQAAVSWAKYLYNDIATSESKKEAVALWDKASDLAFSQDMLIIAKGEGMYDKDIPKEWYMQRSHTRELLQAAENGNPEAQFTKGIEYDLSNNDSRMSWYEKAAAQGHNLATKRLASLKEEKAAKEKAEQEQRALAAKQEAERKARETALKKDSEGMQITWTETLSYDLSSGGIGSALMGAIGLGALNRVDYTVRYVAIVEKVIAGSSVKCIIKNADIESPGWASANWVKYKKYAQAAAYDEVGKTRVLEMDEFDLITK